MRLFEMKSLGDVTMLILFIGTVCAQNGEPLNVTLNPPGTQYVREGSKLNVTCEVNRPLAFLIGNDVKFLIKSICGEDILSNGVKKIGPNAAYFNVEVDPKPGNGIHIPLSILNVTDRFDGMLICRATNKPENGGQTREDSLKIVIIRPIDALRLKLDAAEPITETKTDPVELDPGFHSVACTAEGRNPAATITLNLDGAKVFNISTKSERMELNETKIRTTLTASMDIKGLQPGQKLKCTAESQFGDSHSLELPIKIKQFEPKINCTVPEACEGQKDVIISCTVDYTDLDITSFRYSLGGKDYNSEGNHNDKFFQVSKEQLCDTKVRVHLKLKENKAWHCETEFYMLVVHRNGHISRQSVRLPKRAGNSANFCTALAPILMLPSVWWLF